MMETLPGCISSMLSRANPHFVRGIEGQDNLVGILRRTTPLCGLPLFVVICIGS